MNDFVLIEYSNSVDFGDILYSNGFVNRVYLDADVSKPTYELEEEGTEDADGEFSPTFQKWAKKYSIRFYAQEFLTDALTLMTLHDQVYITLRNGESSKVLDIEVEPTWDNNIECWAETVMTFTTDYIIRKNCDANFDTNCIDPIYTSTYAPQDYNDGSGVDGQYYWENPFDSPTIMFFYADVPIGGGEYRGDATLTAGFYRSGGGQWTLLDIENGDFGAVDSTDYVYLVKCGTAYQKVPYITSVTDNADGTATIEAINVSCVENQFFQAQYNTGGGFVNIGDPQFATAFQSGFIVNCGAGVDIQFRLQWYNHSCTYGYSNTVTETITT